ncbi:putative protein OS=Bosea thiooxidans OX=53254 GN=SAMN05660750_03256 PE=4 SV=1 [Bosea thiooxidans]|uniref:Uncharacterized protein n=1 Tax=Bosea thiooxidans TaxID=53254 RepID=A0A1T5FJF0_9HYPH|nr:hypothetical protein [Bosea thiooxidans]SKB96247.1 hypothetical protein SAMN05660750_03256 [Bosea thiooxidans]
MKAFSILTIAASLSVISAKAQEPQAPWPPAGYAALRFEQIGYGQQKSEFAAQLLDIAGLGYAAPFTVEGVAGSKPARPGNGVWLATLGARSAPTYVFMVNSHATCSQNQCSWAIIRKDRNIITVDACDLIDRAAISSDGGKLRICDQDIELN